MKLITKDTDYAIRALCCIAKNKKKGDIACVTDLVKCLKIPKPFLRKILQALNKCGLLLSFKGPCGGFRLNKPADKIFITDIMQVFQGPFMLCEHTFKTGPCHDVKKCIFKKKLDAIGVYVKKELGTITIKDLIKGS
ncbi:MAG: hypothetical protein COW11_05605 [Candidatus Omnitrophica bacterium CG12_big_fil_rev_8_21_14_0_65_43_15]|uniref:Rrf2 family transcriptional regulator n=1 Tax=Candidatus Taenaricola geysiri TaxID=1974752 RepID=A0A2J0LGL6_9BACT|nr:MAG: hypothetical protein AUJ89_01585 [Candidatus Omnitrophica bacterium CG1_02_43_210]PIR65710.1 MAG: hypothetical protein COU52_02850 [Candidatus Omnitrophica bacterium CG10_big_fil_rev_8_21_14_0_10_43_8]PIV11986.1 MAG: hypothetical protein COS48_03185 [Candidatus Omnitrophica bacterium CG03_land_8_20_14_0_80_43_22]PIW66004.1 MAG: hypothetical protein COW11_05605 [Candidatus Omnitrophica bacterium CG12_big_fil_rev_8_21_14_0_65_43_15]PIW80860.1 MAG: hypothetical protein COZ98_00230 [Candida